MKLVLSTIIVGVVLFLLGWVIYGMLLMEYLKPFYGFMQRPEYDMKIWAFGLASLSQAFFLFIIYSKGYQGGSAVWEGIKFGIIISLFTGIPYILYTWGGMRVPYQPVIVDGIAVMAMTFIGCLLTAIIHGKKDVKVIKAE